MSYRITICVFFSETKIENLAGTHTKTYRVEEVPADQLQVADNEMLVPVGHYQKEPYSAFGNPFLIKVKEGENFDGVKERIQVIKSDWYLIEQVTLGTAGKKADQQAIKSP